MSGSRGVGAKSAGRVTPPIDEARARIWRAIPSASARSRTGIGEGLNSEVTGASSAGMPARRARRLPRTSARRVVFVAIVSLLGGFFATL